MSGSAAWAPDGIARAKAQHNMKLDPEMVQLATRLIERQTREYDPTDFEDRYEARMRELIDAKLKGVGFEAEEEDKPDRGNVIDLMGALRRSLGQSEEAAPPAKRAVPTTPAAKAAPKKGRKELTPD